MKNVFTKSICTTILLLSSITAKAATYDSMYSVSRYNDVGTSSKLLGKPINKFCFLSKVGLRQLGKSNSRSTCTITTSNGNMHLKAILRSNGGGDARCQAICYNK